VEQLDRQYSAVVEFLTEFARHMISSGLTAAALNSAAQLAFVNAAIREARLSNTRINQSIIAAMTGLTRTQVRAAMKGRVKASHSSKDRLGRIVAAWQSDPEFTDEFGKPRALSVERHPADFQALTRKHGRDVSYKALLLELRRRKYVQLAGDKVRIAEHEDAAQVSGELRTIAQALAFSIRAATEDAKHTDVHVVTKEVVYDVLPQKSKLLFRKRLVQGVRMLGADVQAAADSLVTATSRPGRRQYSRTSVLIVTLE
jgi:hypothetical protein